MQKSVERIFPFNEVCAMVVVIGGDYGNDLQYELAGICMIAHVLENYLVLLLEESNLVAIQSKRTCI
jgi:hypothetical protein